MTRVMVSCIAGIVLGILVGHRHVTAASANETAATPMILQENEGEQLIHRAGPLKGVPFTIKVDGQFGRSDDFFVFAETLAPGETIPFHRHRGTPSLRGKRGIRECGLGTWARGIPLARFHSTGHMDLSPKR